MGVKVNPFKIEAHKWGGGDLRAGGKNGRVGRVEEPRVMGWMQTVNLRPTFPSI